MRFKSNQQSENIIAFAGKRTHSVSARRIPHSALLWFLIGLLVLAPFASKIFAQAATAPASSNRWLFMIDTSSGMKRHQADVLEVVNNIITNSATGQMRPGDSVGLWTFNQEVHSDLPAQPWTGYNRDEVAQRTIDFLKRQHYGKSCRLDRAVDDMKEVVSASDVITIFIVSDGHSKMLGTPFDDQINALYRQSLDDMKGHQPRAIVTVLEAKAGRFVRFTVNALPWPVVIPELPLPLHIAETPPPQPANPAPEQNAVTPNPAPPKAPPRILSGPHNSANSAPAPAVNPAPTPAPAPSQTPALAPPPVTQQATLTPPSTHPPANLPTPPASASAQLTPPTPPTLPNPRAMVKPSAPPSSANEAPPPRIAPTPAPVISPLPTNPPVAPVAAQATVTNLASTTPKPDVKPVAPTEPKPTAPASAAVTATNSLAARAMAFVAPETTMAGRPKILLIAGVGLLLLGSLLVIVMLRRSRVTNGPSLITHTMSNKRK